MKTPDVTERMGVFKRFEDVPDEYRLQRHAAKYAGRDVWEEYADARKSGESHVGHPINSKRGRDSIDRVGRYWKSHTDDRDQHHALAQPDDVATFFEGLRDGVYGYRTMKVGSLYNTYFTYLEAFYSWLLWSTNHEHSYHPVWMAVVEYPDEIIAEVWQEKMDSRN